MRLAGEDRRTESRSQVADRRADSRSQGSQAAERKRSSVGGGGGGGGGGEGSKESGDLKDKLKSYLNRARAKSRDR